MMSFSPNCMVATPAVQRMVPLGSLSRCRTDYPLAPEATLPLAPQAVLVAWDWLRGRGFDEIAIIGDSAGGGLTAAMIAALRDRSNGENAVAAVTFSPWVDLAFTGPSMTEPRDHRSASRL